MADHKPSPLARAMWRYDDEANEPHDKLMKTALSRNHSFETLGSIGLVLFVFLVIHVALVFAGFETTKMPALIGTTILTVFWFWLKSKRRAANKLKASQLRKELSELEEVEFKLRFEEAKMNGQLDRWNKNDDHNDDK